MSPFERWFSCSDASPSHAAMLLMTIEAVLVIAGGALQLVPSSSNAYSLACLSTTVFVRICTFKYDALTTLSSAKPCGAVRTL
jgi:hypothetical protein